MVAKSGIQRTASQPSQAPKKEKASFFVRLKRRFYTRDIYFGLEKDPADSTFYPLSKLEFDLQLASQKHILESLYRAQYENKHFLYELIQRKWAFEPGINRCYVALTKDTRDLCCMLWIALPRIENSPHQIREGEFMSLHKDECMLENNYTFEKYRNYNIMPTMIMKLCSIASTAGFKRMVTYVHQGNATLLKDCRKIGFKDFEKQIETKFLMFKRHTRLRIKQPQTPVNILFSAPNARL